MLRAYLRGQAWASSQGVVSCGEGWVGRGKKGKGRGHRGKRAGERGEGIAAASGS